jgi:hypothetical protein
MLDTGAAKKVMGYPTPPEPSEDPEVQVTEFLPGQEVLEQVYRIVFPLIHTLLTKLTARMGILHLHDLVVWFHQAQCDLLLPQDLCGRKQDF